MIYISAAKVFIAPGFSLGCQVSILLVCKNESRSPILWTFNMPENQVPIIAQKSKFDGVYSGHNKRYMIILEQVWWESTWGSLTIQCYGLDTLKMQSFFFFFYYFIVINIILVDVFHNVTKKRQNSYAIKRHMKIIFFGICVSKD